MNSPVKTLSNGGKLFPECDQKRDQVKNKVLEIYFGKFCCKSNTRNFNSPVKTLSNGGKLFPECDQKRDQVKNKVLEIYFGKFCCKSNTRNFNLEFCTSNSIGWS